MSSLEKAVEAANRRYKEQQRDVTAELHDVPNGKAIDLRGSDAPKGIRNFQLLEDIHNSGYVVSNVKGRKASARLFLREAAERFDLSNEVEVTVDREVLFRSLLDVHDWDSRTIVRGDDKVTLNYDGDIDFDHPTIQRRLERVGALDQARAEGVMAVLWLLSLAAVDQNNPWEEFFEEEPLDKEEAKRYLDKNNDFLGGMVVNSAADDTVGVLYTNDERDNEPSDLDLPPGWVAFEETRGFSFTPVGQVRE